MTWIEELAVSLDVEPLTEAETEALLGVARDVAHRVERKVTPLSTFLVGVAVGRGGSLDSMSEKVRDLLPESA